jgi:chromosome segregation ATPase
LPLNMPTDTVSLRIANLVEGLDQVSRLAAELQELGRNSGDAGPEVQALSGELTELGRQQQLINQFRELKQATRDTGAQLEEARRRAGELAREFKATESPSAALSRQFERARQQVRRLADQERRQWVELQQLRGAMRDAGVGADNLAPSQRRVGRALDAARSRAQTLRDSLRGTTQDLGATGSAASRTGRTLQSSLEGAAGAGIGCAAGR